MGWARVTARVCVRGERGGGGRKCGWGRGARSCLHAGPRAGPRPRTPTCRSACAAASPCASGRPSVTTTEKFRPALAASYSTASTQREKPWMSTVVLSLSSLVPIAAIFWRAADEVCANASPRSMRRSYARGGRRPQRSAASARARARAHTLRRASAWVRGCGVRGASGARAPCKC